MRKQYIYFNQYDGQIMTSLQAIILKFESGYKIFEINECEIPKGKILSHSV
jgi:hypothetical protein